jgi:hypothetical protein
MAAGDIPPKARARLRLAENPYAFVDFEGGQSAEAPRRRPTRASPDLKVSRHQERQHDLFAPGPAPVHQSSSVVPSGNPYARVAESHEDDDRAGEAQADAKSQSLSKLEFRRRCTEIFRQYIPDLEGGGLRSYMRDFIARNESQSSRIRYLVLRGLAKFDLSDLSAATPLFNREDESLSEQKLRDIERPVGEDE